MRWSWTTFHERRRELVAALASPACRHLAFVRLHSRAEVERFLDGAEAGCAPAEG